MVNAVRVLEDSFAEEIKQHIAHTSGNPTYVLVGSRLLGLHLRKRLVKSGVPCFNIRFVTFSDLAKKILESRLAAQGRRALPTGAAQILLRRQLATLDPSHVFYPQRDKSGFVRMLRNHFQQLIDDERPGHDSVAALFQGYRRSYLKKFYTPSDLVAEAALVDSASIVQSLNASTLFHYGFVEFTRLQERLLQACGSLMKIRGNKVPCGENGVHVDATALGAAVECLSFANPLAEAQGVVRTIMARVSEGKSLEKMAILLPKPELFRIYARLLDQSGLRYFVNGGIPMEDLPSGQALLRLIDLLREPAGRKEWMDCLAHLPFSKSVVANTGEPADWAAWSKEASLSSDVSRFASKLAVYVEQAESEKKTFAPALSAFTTFFTEFLRASLSLTSPRTSWTEASEVWLRWVQRFFISDEVVQKMAQVLATLPDLEGTGIEPTSTALLEIVQERLEDAAFSRGRFQSNALYLGTAPPVGCITFETMYVPAFTDDIYPRKEFIHPWLQGGEASRPVGPEQVYESLWKQADHYVVSYPRKSLLNQDLYPSPWMRNIQARSLLPWQLDPAEAIDEADWKQTTLAHEILRRKNTRPEQWSELSPLFGTVGAWVEQRLGSAFFGPYDGYLGFREGLRKERFSAKHIADFSKCPYQYYLRHVLKLSHTDALDDSWSMEKMDRGNMIHDILFQLFSALKSKDLFPLLPENKPMVHESLRSIANRVFAEMERTKHVGIGLLWEMEKSWLMQDLMAFLEPDFESGSAYIPEAFEVRFGMPARSDGEDQTYSSNDTVDVDLTDGRRIGLYGRIDRVDLSPDKQRARVIDYKTGSVSGTKDDAFMGGQSAQLPVYLLATNQLFPTAELSQSEATLLSTSFVGGFERKHFSGKVLEARREEFGEILRTVVDFHEHGKFPPNPGKQQQNCTFCEFKPVCGKSVVRAFERKKGDPTVADYLALEEIK